MGIGAAIVGFFSALPDMIKLVQQLMTWVEHVSGNDTQGFIQKVTLAFQQLNEAKTPLEKQDAAKSIADLVRKLP